MSSERRTPHRATSRRARVIAVAAVVAASAALAVPAASASPSGNASPVAAQAALLAATTSAVDHTAVAGTAWYTDATTGKVVVTVDSTVPASAVTAIENAVPQSSALTVRHTAGQFRPLVAGGDAIQNSEFRCSLGFNVRSGSTYYALTAGHCTAEGGTTWSTPSGTRVGTTADSQFPGNDYGLIRLSASAANDGRVDLYNGSYQDITSAGTARVGQRVTRSGSTSGVHSGTVLATNATVRYQEGTVSGLIDTNVCAEPGDSGGPLFSGTTALGLTSGGSGDCSSGGETFFQPVTEPLSAYGLSIF